MTFVEISKEDWDNRPWWRKLLGLEPYSEKRSLELAVWLWRQF
jgi:hypothetical protein